MSFRKILITLGILLILTGISNDVYQFYQIFKKDPNEVIFEIPGTTSFDVTTPGKYTVWHNYKTLHNGEVFNGEQALPAGTRISVRGSVEGLLTLSSDSSTSSSRGSHSKVSIGTVTLNSPQTLTIEVSGDTSKSVMSFSESTFMKSFLFLFVGSFLTFIPGGGLLFWGCMLKNKQSPPPLPTS